jgi:hypothetical protein
MATLPISTMDNTNTLTGAVNIAVAAAPLTTRDKPEACPGHSGIGDFTYYIR